MARMFRPREGGNLRPERRAERLRRARKNIGFNHRGDKFRMWNPLVSVVTPSFNQAKFLREALLSVELQDYRPIHQIVIDGGSKDGSVELLKEWDAADHGPGYTFDWISAPDRGNTDGVNKGFDQARGEVVGWLNSDDVYFDRHAISTSVLALDEHKGIDVVFGDVALISEDGGLQMIWCFPPFDYQRALRGYIIPQPTVFFRRCVIDRHRIDPNIPLTPDLRYWLEIGREHRFLKISRVQAADRDHGARLGRVAKTGNVDTSREARAAHGGSAKQKRLDIIFDGCWRVAMRFRGLVHVLKLASRNDLANKSAFPIWIDSIPRIIKRQLSMRVHARAPMGPRRS